MHQSKVKFDLKNEEKHLSGLQKPGKYNWQWEKILN
jgi:hypothetical protein